MRSDKSMYEQAVTDYQYIVTKYGKKDDLAEAYSEAFDLVFGLSNGYRFSYELAARTVVGVIQEMYYFGHVPHENEHLSSRVHQDETHVSLPVANDKRLQRIRDRWQLQHSE